MVLGPHRRAKIARELLDYNAKNRLETPEILARARHLIQAIDKRIGPTDAVPAALEDELTGLYLRLSLSSTAEEEKAVIRLVAGYLEVRRETSLNLQPTDNAILKKLTLALGLTGGE